MKFERAAFKWKVTEEEILEVLDDPLTQYYIDRPSKRGFNRLVFVGPTVTNRVLEIGVEYRTDGKWCYHAKKATKKAKERADYEG